MTEARPAGTVAHGGPAPAQAYGAHPGHPPSGTGLRSVVARRWSEARPALTEAAGATWLPWVLARLVVLGTLGLAKYEVDDLHLADAKAVLQTHLGLLGSDAGWYQAIAAHGYHGASRASVRFFPLYPGVARVLHLAFGLPVSAVLLVVANGSAFGATMLLYLLARRELGPDAAVGRTAVWLFSLAPVAFVFVMGYAEGLFVLLATACFVGLRRRLWWSAAVLGALAGLCRPIGCLLALAAAVEVLRGSGRPSAGELAGRAAAVAGPVVGFGAYLLWVGHAFGDALLPLRIQEQSGHHGVFTDPLVTLYHDGLNLVHRHHIGTDIHLPWVLVAVALAVVAFRRLPASYGLFAAGVLAVALSGSNLDSFERYALSAFPLVLAAATLLRSRRVALTVLVVSTAALVGYGLLAFQGAYVP